MVNEITTCGLIVTHTARPTALVDELVALCDWPVLTRPTLRALVEQIELIRPLCVAFWLETAAEIAHTAELIARLRDRGGRPYRIAIAHSLEASVEPTFRSAGVHSYFATTGNLHALFDDAILPFIDMHRAAASTAHPVRADHPVAIRGPTEARASPATVQPP